MKEERFDEIARLAFANLHQPGPPDAFKEGMKDLPRAPLAALIDGMLEEQPGFSLRTVLEEVARLNQGALEDMDRPDFQSYLIGKLGISETNLRRCIQALRTYRRVSQGTSGEKFLAAAREENGDSVGSADIDEIRNLLKKRK